MMDDPISIWLDELKREDHQAAQHLWNHFYSKLIALARRKFDGLPRRTYDEEDAALSAFRSFCDGIANNRFPDLFSRDDLWSLLVTIAARKVIARKRYEHRARRGGQEVWEELLFEQNASEGLAANGIQCREPTPEFAMEVADQLEVPIHRLDQPVLREIVSLKLEGYTNDEIAANLGGTRRSVQRTLAVIRAELGDLEAD